MTLFFRVARWLWPGVFFVLTIGMSCFGQAPITNGLVARWSGDGNAKDSAGHSDGQASGGLSYGPGPSGQAFQFNGGGAKVDFGGTAGNFGTRDFTLALWMKNDSQTPWCASIGKRATCDAMNPFWDIRIGGRTVAPGVVQIEFTGGGNKALYYLASTRPINDGQWHHIAWVRQSTSSGSISCLIYLDGALDNSLPLSDAVDCDNPTPLVLGQNICQCCDGTRPYSGAAAEVQIFSHALSAEEILALCKAGKSGR